VSTINRRILLKGLLGGLIQAAGTVVLARAVLPDAPEEKPTTPTEIEERADRLAEELPASPDGLEPIAFLNGRARAGFRNGGFVNGGFRNGSFRNGGFVNGGFRNAGFRNGGFANGGFRKGAWRNL
jgi:hypothetical protein